MAHLRCEHKLETRGQAIRVDRDTKNFKKSSHPPSNPLTPPSTVESSSQIPSMVCIRPVGASAVPPFKPFATRPSQLLFIVWSCAPDLLSPGRTTAITCMHAIALASHKFCSRHSLFPAQCWCDQSLGQAVVYGLVMHLLLQCASHHSACIHPPPSSLTVDLGA